MQAQSALRSPSPEEASQGMAEFVVCGNITSRGRHQVRQAQVPTRWLQGRFLPP